MEEIEEQIDDEDLAEDEELDAAEADEAAATATASPPPKDAADADVESIEELIVKKEAQAEDEDEDAVLSLTREERLVEPVTEKVVPPQSSEFICKKCYLVKHRSQLKDKARTLCRDCA
jgi:hypothetical protein